MPENIELSDELRQQLDNLLSSTDLSGVTAEGQGYLPLEEGYYLGEVKKATLTVSKSSGNPMVSLQFQIVKDGYQVSNELVEDYLTAIPHTKGRSVFVHYPFSDKQSVTRFASDMEKFEGDEPGVPLLPKEAFANSLTLEDALRILEETNKNVWLKVSQAKTINQQTGQPNYFTNLISWKRATDLGLPE